MSLNPARAGRLKPVPAVACCCGCATRPRRYPSDLTDAQWVVLAPLLPVRACLRPGGGRPERHCRRQIVNALFYLVDNGIKWRAMPADFPPWRTVYGFFTRWSDNLSTVGVTDALRAGLRVALGRNRQPSAGVIDSQSVHASAEGVVPTATSGYDGHKRVSGRKRHIIVDTEGLLCRTIVSAADMPDQHAAPALLYAAAELGIRHIWADQGYYVQHLIDAAHNSLDITLQILVRPPETTGKGHGFHLLPRRWVVERSFAWISRRRRCARDYERRTDHHETMIHWAAIYQMTRRRARLPPTQDHLTDQKQAL